MLLFWQYFSPNWSKFDSIDRFWKLIVPSTSRGRLYWCCTSNRDFRVLAFFFLCECLSIPIANLYSVFHQFSKKDHRQVWPEAPNLDGLLHISWNLCLNQWCAIPIPELELESEFQAFQGLWNWNRNWIEGLNHMMELERAYIFKGGIGIESKDFVRNRNWIGIDFCQNCTSLI